MTPDVFDPGKYWETRLKERFDLSGVGSIDLSPQYNAWLYRLRKHFFRRHIAPRVSRENIQSVLDIGSGTGFYVERWLEAGVTSVTGLDITETSVTRLSEKFGEAQFIRDDIGLAGSPLPLVDAVSAFDVLFHIIDDGNFECAIRRIAQALRPGGLFVLSDVFQRYVEFRSVHQAGRTLDQVETALKDAGFVIECRRPVFVTMVDPTDTCRAIWRTLWQRTISLAQRPGPSNVLGATLYSLDLLLCEMVKEGPSIEVMFCRRSAV